MQPKLLFQELSADEARKLVDRNNPECPLSKFVGNSNCVEALSDVAFAGLMREDRSCPGVNVAFYGLHGGGKTTLARLFSEVLGLPFLVMQAVEITNMDYLISKISNRLEEEFIYLTPVSANVKTYYEIPPLVIFIDEVHGIHPSVSDGILSALERKTTYLSVGCSEYNFKNVYWSIATTERGRIPLPLESRFIPLNLLPYTVEEVALIVKLNTGWEESVCLQVAKFTRIPRDAVAFSQQVMYGAQRNNISLTDAIDLVAKRRGIDESGIDERQYKVMMALAENAETGKSLKSLCSVIGVNKEEMEVHILPILLVQSFIKISNRHLITDVGLSFLKSKGMI